MAEVCVITGGGSGMGLAAAKFMPKKQIIVLGGRTAAKLEHAVTELTGLGFTVRAFACDTSKRSSVQELVRFSASLGEVKTVLNCAGVSPSMANGETVLRINALGTVYMNQEFSRIMDRGAVIVDVASNSAYVLPSFLISTRTYALAETDEALFLKKLLKKSNLARNEYQKAGLAYALSKNFTVWFAKKCAFEYGKKSIRVVSLSPGLIDTDMGKAEKNEGGAIIPHTAENRMGTPEELGFALASVADPRNGYLTGVDVLCDGGGTTGQNEFKQFKW